MPVATVRFAAPTASDARVGDARGGSVVVGAESGIHFSRGPGGFAIFGTVGNTERRFGVRLLSQVARARIVVSQVQPHLYLLHRYMTAMCVCVSVASRLPARLNLRRNSGGSYKPQTNAFTAQRRPRHALLRRCSLHTGAVTSHQRPNG